MKLGILADTHDQLERTQQAIETLRNAGVTAVVHCGDLASPPIVAALACLPSWFVFGNHDSDMTPYLENAAMESGVVCLGWGGIVEFNGRRIAVAHGHLTTDIRRVLAASPDYLLTGHTHYPFETVRDGVRQINPGALHRADQFTVAVLDLDCGRVSWLVIE